MVPPEQYTNIVKQYNKYIDDGLEQIIFFFICTISRVWYTNIVKQNNKYIDDGLEQ